MRITFLLFSFIVNTFFLFTFTLNWTFSFGDFLGLVLVLVFDFYALISTKMLFFFLLQLFGFPEKKTFAVCACAEYQCFLFIFILFFYFIFLETLDLV